MSPKGFIVDKAGHRRGIILDLPTYRTLLKALEEVEDRKAFDAAKRQRAVPYSKLAGRLKRNGLL